jgi:hypothetical protein
VREAADYRELLITALALGDRNCGELVRLKLAMERAIVLLRWRGDSERALALLEAALKAEL